MVGEDHHRALRAAERAAEQARSAGDAGAWSVALRAAGLAVKETGDLTTAEQLLRQAIRLAGRAGLDQEAAEARMTLAFVVLTRGRLRSALSLADAAAAQLSGVAGARVAAQRALVLQRCGRDSEALAEYARALPVLRRAGDEVWEARLRTNRGLLLTYRGELAAAEADLRRALELDTAAGRHVDVAGGEWNLGFVAGRRGDVPTALTRFDVAEAAYERYDRPSPGLLTDRCEVLLAAGLAHEARQAAERAVGLLAAAGQGADLAEGRLVLAQAALADGDLELARSTARRCARELAHQQRDTWALVAQYVTLRADERLSPPSRRLLSSALACADALERAQWPAPELDLRLLAARTAIALDDLDEARRQLGRAAVRRHRSPADLRARAWYAQALLRRAAGDRRGTWAALRAGLRAVERTQSSMGGTELRVRVAVHGVDLARTGLALALEERSAVRVLAWTERWRSGALRLRPVRSPRDTALAEALSELRRLTARLEEARLDGRPTRAIEAERSAAQNRVVTITRSTPSGLYAAPAPPPSVADLARALDGDTLLEYVEYDGDLHVVAVADRRASLHALGPVTAVAEEVDAARFALRRLAAGFGSATGLSAVRADADACGTALDAMLLQAVPTVRRGQGRLVVVPSAALHAVPWGLLPTARSRALTVCPSAAAWLRAVSSAFADPGDRVVLAAGPGLPGARDEVGRIAGQYPAAALLVGDAAAADAVLAALDGAALAHLATHGRLRTDNPLFSSLLLADGPLTIYDLERIERAPATVLLPACQSGVSTVHAGDELMGLVSALLALGSSRVAATVVPVPDGASASFMLATHKAMADGLSLDAAMTVARTGLDTGDHGSYAVGAGFVAYGA